MTNDPLHLEGKLRRTPSQTRSRDRLRRMLDAADEVLASEGAAGFTTTRIAAAAGVPIGSFYQFFERKQAITEALALSYWSDFEDLVSGVADSDALDPLEDPGSTVIEVLAAGFRARPGFLALWYGGLRDERIREVTRPTREAIARSILRILANHWSRSESEELAMAARMVVLAGDGLLREAFRLDRRGDSAVLAESKVMLASYLRARLGPPQR